MPIKSFVALRRRWGMKKCRMHNPLPLFSVIQLSSDISYRSVVAAIHKCKQALLLQYFFRPKWEMVRYFLDWRPICLCWYLTYLLKSNTFYKASDWIVHFGIQCALEFTFQYKKSDFSSVVSNSNNTCILFGYCRYFVRITAEWRQSLHPPYKNRKPIYWSSDVRCSSNTLHLC